VSCIIVLFIALSATALKSTLTYLLTWTTDQQHAATSTMTASRSKINPQLKLNNNDDTNRTCWCD